MRRGTNDAPAWHALGLLRVHAGELAGAEQAYRAGLAADGKAAECHLGLATVAALRGDAASALTEYEAILAQWPRFAPAHLGRAWALGRLGRKGEARESVLAAEKSGGASRASADVRRSLDVAEDGPATNAQPPAAR